MRLILGEKRQLSSANIGASSIAHKVSFQLKPRQFSQRTIAAAFGI
jgi:hypothetical protein